MRKYLWFILLLLSFRVTAQVSMTVQLPPAGVIMKAQLWNIVLVSASTRPVDVRIAIRVSDAQTNQPLFTGITRSISLKKGAKQLQLADVMPVQYEYLSATTDRSVNGLLSAGNFLACYTLIVESGGDKGGDQPGEDCIPFTIEPLSPPLLNSPADQSVLDTKLPQFTWLPPAPLNMFSDLNYEMILTEVHTGQSAQESVQQNIPVYRAPYLKNIFVNYPSGGLALDTGRNYAWTVIAKNGPQFAAQTEIWTFRIKGVSVNERAYEEAYVQLKRELDGAATTSTGTLQFAYNNEAGDAAVKYEIVALDEGNKVVQNGELTLKPGANLLQLKLGRNLNAKQHYLFRLLNKRQERWQIKFIHTSTDKR